MFQPLRQRIAAKLQELKQGNLTLPGLAYYFVLKQYGFPYLLLRWPQAIWRLGCALLERCTPPLYAFTSFDLWLRTYYSKLVRNFRQVGRWGYVWDESLGFPMGPRFGSNTATYALYGALSPQGFSFLSLALYLGCIIITGIMAGHTVLALTVPILIVASPAIVFSLAAYGVKPEIVWWALTVPLLYAAFIHNWTAVWILLGGLLLVNTSVSVILGAMLIGPWVLSLLQGQFTFGLDLLCLAPGLLVRFWRFLSAYLEGNLNATVREQSAVRKKASSEGKTRVTSAWKATLANLAPLSLKIFSLLVIAGGNRWIESLALGASLIIVFVLNKVWVKIADNVTIQIVAVSAVISMALFSGTWFGLLAIFLLAYENPFSFMPYTAGKQRQESLNQEVSQMVGKPLRAKISYYRVSCKDYPWLSPMDLPRPATLMQMFDQIPGRSRLLLEGDGDPRSVGRFSRFHEWTYEFLPSRQIEFLNHTFLNRMLEPLLAEHYLHDFAVPHLMPQTLHEVCCKLGVSHIITFTSETAVAFEHLGYTRAMTVPYQDYRALANTLYMPEVDLALFVNPESAGVIYPEMTWSRRKNTMTWEAEAGRAYTLRYRFNSQFVAHQGRRRLAIEPQPVFDDLPLRFMRVKAENDQPITVTFVPRLI